ncbi:CrcB family protein [Wenzhouxiangella sp. XN24]|uniref:fluoride efflux transporter FluC n=1 Tax=Wenzhouxiangella sp. XN24 TaxID=2713569 RepID=UPI0013EBD355|nr:CrcB family protein [Wenzhouxiangella sp. XN24]NGX14856.1 chromosome condensation protein CrcB [Wenzhouxiangella sp. XN24]
MSELAAILVGSALGGVARMWFGACVARRFGTAFPWHTLAVNMSGALAIGVLAGVLSSGLAGGVSGGLAGGLAGGSPGTAWWLLGIGVLGSYTTVSSFSLESLALAHAGRWRAVAANIGLSLGLCLPAVAAGVSVGAWLSGSGW